MIIMCILLSEIRHVHAFELRIFYDYNSSSKNEEQRKFVKINKMSPDNLDVQLKQRMTSIY